MQAWILEADIVRLKKAWREADAHEQPRIAAFLRKAEGHLFRLRCGRNGHGAPDAE